MGGRVTAVAVVESQPGDHVRRGGFRRRLEDDRQRRHLDAGLRRSERGSPSATWPCPSPIPDIVWVGTGEANARNSVSWGDGVYKSHRRRQNLEAHGAEGHAAHRPNRSSIRKNPDIVYVAALGHLWGPNKERGLYKTHGRRQDLAAASSSSTTTPASSTWPWIPPIPDTLYAAAYRVRRDAFSGGNPGHAVRPRCRPLQDQRTAARPGKS